jgi:hypothetical protein
MQRETKNPMQRVNASIGPELNNPPRPFDPYKIIPANSKQDVGQNFVCGGSVIISEWRRNKREMIRIALSEYQGHKTVDIRVWYATGDGNRPTRTGLTLGLRHLPDLANALALAHYEAKARGLIKSDAA